MFRDLRAHNRYAHKVAAMLREQHEQRIAQVLQAQRKHRIPGSR